MTIPADEYYRDPISDESDKATAAELLDLENRITSARRAAKQTQSPNAQGEYEITDCEGCGSEIGEERIRVSLMNTLCIHCASEKERRFSMSSR